MQNKITGFHTDDESHWVAELACGHNQHVRHDPPWMNRVWVLTPEGRDSRLGIQLDCKKCDDGEPRDRPEEFDPEDYLGSCDTIDINAPTILSMAERLRGNDTIETARQCFEFVRDEIRHSSDFKLNPVTCQASDALEHKTGYCYAKSHLLCALLRAIGIPAGLCYQRLSLDGIGPPFCLHGLNAVFLPEFGWYRVDPRGNRSGIDAQFTPPIERLAFSLVVDGERDLKRIHVRPRVDVLGCLRKYDDWKSAYDNLPDIQ